MFHLLLLLGTKIFVKANEQGAIGYYHSKFTHLEDEQIPQ